VLDGGGYPPDPEELLKPGGTVVIDDLTPGLDLAALVATRRFPA